MPGHDAVLVVEITDKAHGRLPGSVELLRKRELEDDPDDGLPTNSFTEGGDFRLLMGGGGQALYIREAHPEAVYDARREKGVEGEVSPREVIHIIPHRIGHQKRQLHGEFSSNSSCIAWLSTYGLVVGENILYENIVRFLLLLIHSADALSNRIAQRLVVRLVGGLARERLNHNVKSRTHYMYDSTHAVEGHVALAVIAASTGTCPFCVCASISVFFTSMAEISGGHQAQTSIANLRDNKVGALLVLIQFIVRVPGKIVSPIVHREVDF